MMMMMMMMMTMMMMIMMMMVMMTTIKMTTTMMMPTTMMVTAMTMAHRHIFYHCIYNQKRNFWFSPGFPFTTSTGSQKASLQPSNPCASPPPTPYPPTTPTPTPVAPFYTDWLPISHRRIHPFLLPSPQRMSNSSFSLQSNGRFILFFSAKTHGDSALTFCSLDLKPAFIQSRKCLPLPPPPPTPTPLPPALTPSLSLKLRNL